MRAWARWGITPLLAAPAGAWALALGDIELQSALNQPFRAEIALTATTDELLGLRVMLAAPDMFERRGIDRPQFLSNLEFRVVSDRAGRSVVQVTSRESIAEPFVTLLVEATSARGRSVKEYTVLLDPPVFLPAPAAPAPVRPAETRTSGNNAPGGQINRPATPPPAPPAERAPAPAPAVREPAAEAPVSSTAPPAPRAPVSAAGGTYGPVQRAETLWAIADRLRPDGVTINQMMIAIYQANPAAFGGNINVLRAGATLQLPEAADFDTLATTVANAEVQRQTDAWQNRTPGGQLRLLPPTESAVTRDEPPAPAPAQPTESATAAADRAAADRAAADAAAAAAAEESRRLVEIQNAELQRAQQAAAAADAPQPAESEAEPGVEVEDEQLFADETEAEPAPAAEEEAAPAPAPARPAPQPVASEPSLVSQAIGWLKSPLLLIGVGVALLSLMALWFVRRRRQETEDVTGRWEALESETDDDQIRTATERMRRQLPEETIVVEEQHAQSVRPAPQPEPEQPARRAAASRPQRGAVAADETLSSQTVINLDQADAVAEADFHIAYGLYDQAAELVQKALEAAPDRRDLKLKLLEVYFMWGNKDAFLKSAQALRADIGQGDDADWNKVVIMGRQICPDERLFTEATTGPGRVDVDLEAGDSPLDLAFDDAASADVASAASSGLDFDLETSDRRPAPKPAAKPAARDFGGDALDIGARTAAGLEAALFEDLAAKEDEAGRTTPDVTADSLAITQESPTVERPGSSDWLTVESPTAQYAADAPTVETPTIESPAAKSAQTMASKTVAIPRRSDPPTVEQPALSGAATSEFTAEIDLDDLGLDVKDIDGLPTDLGDLPMAPSHETDTREQPALRDDDALLSATGVTKVLHGGDDDSDADTGRTSVLADQDATLMAPGFDEGTSTLTGTEVLEGRLEDDESGNTSLVKSLRAKDAGGVDLDLADLTAALHGADTVEQPRTSSFSRDVFGGGDTPLDLDIGVDSAGGDDDPTGTEEVGLDPQTMTEVGTKLDLARAYIDMGDPEGARSILEEVLDEGDSSQRREAQGLIDVLSA